MKQDHDMVAAVRVVFEGRVQGVGFRYTAAQLANEFQIRGWVRNAFDGSVELIAAAADENLEQFLEALQSRMARNIRQMHKQPASLSAGVTSFEIRG